jgi:8-oxo-dGTP pyrophosphatase MutT (NUDIX family)
VGSIRNSAKAVIINDQKLLAIKKEDDDGFYYILPGGGQEIYEDFASALKRECLEEIGADVIVGELRYVREYIGQNHEFAHDDHDRFRARVKVPCLSRRRELITAEPSVNIQLAAAALTRLVLRQRLRRSVTEETLGDIE